MDDSLRCSKSKYNLLQLNLEFLKKLWINYFKNRLFDVHISYIISQIVKAWLERLKDSY